MSERDPAYRSTDTIPLEVLGEEHTEIQAFSFVVRVYHPPEAEGTEFRGWVEHVQSEHRTHFIGLDRVPAIISEHFGIHTGRMATIRDWLSHWYERLRGWFNQQSEAR